MTEAGGKALEHGRVQGKILCVAHFLTGGRDDEAATRAALERRWLDASGAPTREGLELVAAVSSQADTRSAFRNLF